MFNRNEVRKYGIDWNAQAVRGDGLVTGRMLATQVIPLLPGADHGT